MMFDRRVCVSLKTTFVENTSMCQAEHFYRKKCLNTFLLHMMIRMPD